MKMTLEFESREEYQNWIDAEIVKACKCTAPGAKTAPRVEMPAEVEVKVGGNDAADEPAVTVNPVYTDEDRARIKARLDELGIEYKDRARTETLAAQLEEFEANYVPIEEDDPAPQPEPSEAEAKTLPEQSEDKPEGEYTAESVTECLKNVMSEKGMETARGILAEFEAKNVSSLDPANYAACVAKCESALS